jgi:hypothetical protein
MLQATSKLTGKDSSGKADRFTLELTRFVWQRSARHHQSAVEPRNRMVQLRRFGGPERLDMIDEPLRCRRELVLVPPPHRMTERGQSNHVAMTRQSGMMVDRNLVTAMVWQRRIVRGCDVDRA